MTFEELSMYIYIINGLFPPWNNLKSYDAVTKSKYKIVKALRTADKKRAAVLLRTAARKCLIWIDIWYKAFPIHYVKRH